MMAPGDDAARTPEPTGPPTGRPFATVISKLARFVIAALCGTTFGMIVFGLCSAAVPTAGPPTPDHTLRGAPDPPQDALRIVLPPTALRGVPVDRIEVERATFPNAAAGRRTGRVVIRGVRVVRGGRIDEPAQLELVDGRAEIRTDWAHRTFVYITRSHIVAHSDDGSRAEGHVHLLRSWSAFLPPLLAVALCLLTRDVYVSLVAAIWAGAAVLSPQAGWSDLWWACTETLDAFVVQQIAEPGSRTSDHARILVFTLLLGGMVGVQQLSVRLLRGGTSGRATFSRRRGQLTAALLGCLVFFDDYANTLFVGGTLRPLRRRMRMSAEKLAFLIDATAAPVAGLAVVSTWVGFEIGQIQAGLDVLGGSGSAGGYELFLASLPYRLYPLVLLLLVFVVAASGRDFGPMWRAEVDACRTTDAGDDDDAPALRDASRPDSTPMAPAAPRTDDRCARADRPRALIAVGLPLVTLLVVLGGTLWHSAEARLRDMETPTLWERLAAADANAALLHASFAALATATAAAVALKVASFQQAVAAALQGMAQMLPALVILVLAWGLAAVCDGEHLNTAGALVASFGEHLAAADMPWVTFLLAALMSFATGSSFSTMGLLMPVVMAVTHHLLIQGGVAPASAFTHPHMLGAVGAVLAGAIFGDHCSPISDTTVLSSASAGCDHLRHVVTQLPYALLAALCTLMCGYLPLRFGIGIYVCLPLTAAAVGLSFWRLARPVEEKRR